MHSYIGAPHLDFL